MVAISGKICSNHRGVEFNEKVDDHAALCWPKIAQGQGEARMRQVGHTRRARTRGCTARHKARSINIIRGERLGVPLGGIGDAAAPRICDQMAHI
jgi:hypothetical protein